MSEQSQLYLDPMSTEVIKQYILLNKVDSNGAFGVIYRAKNTTTGELCAAKIIDLGKCSENSKHEFLPKELAALICVNHDNVIRIYHIYMSRHKLYIFMQFASNGSLYDYLEKNGAMSEVAASRWFHQVMDAIRYIHEELKIAHRDIKTGNILINDKMNAILTDFGFVTNAVHEKTGEVIMSETYCGTKPYYSPQIALSVPYNPFCADVWAMGVVLFTMLTNEHPFQTDDLQAMVNQQNDFPNHIRLKFMKYLPKCSHDCQEINERMLIPSEARRITVRQILSHSWVTRRAE